MSQNKSIGGIETDLDHQDAILPGVSRTFALTIPQLPKRLREVVTNAYLLCRIADTIEDDASLAPREKEAYLRALVAVLDDEMSAGDLAADLGPKLSGQTPEAERDLIASLPRIIRVTKSFGESQQAALRRCIDTMCRRMPEFQHHRKVEGLETQSDLDRYCYCVAGIVGEMLTDMFCDYSDEIALSREDLFKLAASFGQGLQMTNILKDVWDDRHSGTCWLPRDVFDRIDLDLTKMSPHTDRDKFNVGLSHLIAIAHGHLRNALAYTLMIPRHETGIRRFCSWAIGLAVLTLRKIHTHPDFSTGAQVKVSRRTVKLTVVVCNLASRSDALLKKLFDMAAAVLPLTDVWPGEGELAVPQPAGGTAARD